MGIEQREVWITGIGLVTALGDGVEANWAALTGTAQPTPILDRDVVAPFVVHHVPEIDFSTQIPKRGDQRQMELWQRLGVYAAGLALDAASANDDEELKSAMDMIVAADGGERDIETDNNLFTGLLTAEDREALLIERLSNDLRPTLFLAQLPNLVAGNISIVHGVTGSSRTFMGEEAAGHDAIRIAHSRIAAGQSEICLVGGAFNARREDMVLLFEMDGYNWTEVETPVWQRSEAADGNGGLALGSMAAFLILEDAAHAKARGVTPVAALDAVVASRGKRTAGHVTSTLEQLWQTANVPTEGPLGVLSGATGVAGSTAEEAEFLRELDNAAQLDVRAPGHLIGHGLESEFPVCLSLAALCARDGQMYPDHGGRLTGTGEALASANAIEQVAVISIGHWRGEGLGLVRKVS
ncbi:MAG: beta-ketoacyl-ACP synthase [Pseudomonadota bacterium]